MEITLPSGRKIGDNQPCFVIAEVGSNWTNLQDCLDSIHKAKACGADAVKFQAFDHQSLYGKPDPNPKPGHITVGWNSDCGEDYFTWNSSVMKYRLPLDWLPVLKKKADAVGIEFMCSAFSPELVEAVDPYVTIHKVASAELTHVRILEKLRQIGKPVFLSTGASGVEDIRQALEMLALPNESRSYWTDKDFNTNHVVLMYCVAAYPARTIDLRNIPLLRDTFNTLAGYSDHSTDALTIPYSAIIGGGACVLEKHVIFIEAGTPDSRHSLTADEFKAMVKSIREQRAKPVLGPTPEEKPMILRHNRRLVTTKDIQEGDTLTEGVNFGIYRSLKDDTHAYSPWLVNEVNGKTVKRAISAGNGIGPGDV